MEQALTIDEIDSRFESEWILLDEPQTNDNLEVLSGLVLFHSKDRDAVYQEAVLRRPKRSAILFMGEIPDDSIIAL